MSRKKVKKKVIKTVTKSRARRFIEAMDAVRRSKEWKSLVAILEGKPSAMESLSTSVERLSNVDLRCRLPSQRRSLKD